MRWPSFFRRQPDEQRATLKEVDFWLRDGGWQSVASGVNVTPETAIQVPDVYACVSVLAQDVGRCPLKLRVSTGDGEMTDAVDHHLWEILHDLPNPETTATEFRDSLMRDLLREEVAYAEIVRRPNGTIKGLWRLDPCRMTVTRNAFNVKVYTYRVEGGQPIVWTFDPDRPPLLELRAPSPIKRCRDLVGMAIALDRYAGKFFANGTRLSGLLHVPAGTKPEGKQGIREMFESMHKGVENAHKIGVIEGATTFTPLSSTNDEAQFNETRKQIRTMIAGAFRVPPHKIGDLERATFSNIEQQSLEFVTYTILPYLRRLEQSMSKWLLDAKDRKRLFVRFNFEGLLRADSAGRAQLYSIMLQNGVLTRNEVRALENRNQLDIAEMDQPTVQSNMALLDQLATLMAQKNQPGLPT